AADVCPPMWSEGRIREQTVCNDSHRSIKISNDGAQIQVPLSEPYPLLSMLFSEEFPVWHQPNHLRYGLTLLKNYDDMALVVLLTYHGVRIQAVCRMYVDTRILTPHTLSLDQSDWRG
ncbi:hypothetical protein KUCAC02_002344, partial [Chaenocephalus aceratus]